VIAVDAAGNRSDKANLNVTTLAGQLPVNPNIPTDGLPTLPDLIAPTVPTGFSSVSIGEGAYRVSWTASTDNVATTGYNVFLNGRFLSSITGPQYVIRGLKPGVNYDVQVQAYDRAGNRSARSANFSLVSVVNQPPTVPTGLVASAIRHDGFIINWNASTDPDGTVRGYNIYLNNVYVTFVQNRTYVFRGLTASTKYYVSVLAVDNDGLRSGRTTELEVTTATPPDTEPPTVPQNLVNTHLHATKALITWNPSTDNVGVTGYNVFLNDVYVKTVTNPATEFINLTQLTSYTVKVFAADAAKNRSAFSQVLTFTTKDGIAPTVPLNVTSSEITKRGFRVSWTASTDNIGVEGYHIYRNGVYVNTVKNGATSFVLSKLDVNQTHQISVQAFDLAGNRSAQTAQSAISTTYTPDWIAPDAPTNLTVSNVTKTSLRLNWTVATDNSSTDTSGVTRYQVYRNGTYIATVNGGTTTLRNVFNLTPNTTYTFTIRADDAENNRSVDSNVVSITTLP